MGRGRAAPQAKTEDEARPGPGHHAGAESGHGPQSRSAVPSVREKTLRKKGKTEQEQQSGPGADAIQGKEDQFEEMKEALELLNNQVEKLQKENVKDKEELKKQVEKFSFFEEECGANVERTMHS